MAEVVASPSQVDPPVTSTVGVIERKPVRHAWLLLAALLDLIWIFNLLTLLRYPGPSADEADVVERALRFVRASQLLESGRSSPIESLGSLWTDHAILSPWIQSLAVDWLGLGLYSMRVVSLACGIVLLAAVYAIAVRLRGSSAAILAVLLTAFSTGFLTASHVALLDSMVAAFGYGAIAFALLNRASTLRATTCLAGLVAACAVSVDPSGIIYLPALLVVIVFGPAGSTRRDRARWMLSGFGPGLLCLFIVPVVALLGPGSGASLASISTRALTSVSPEEWLRSMVGNVRQFADVSNARLPLVIGALASLGVGQPTIKRSPRVLSLVLFATLFFEYSIFHSVGSPTSVILITPFADVIVALLLVRLATRNRSSCSMPADQTLAPWIPIGHRGPSPPRCDSTNLSGREARREAATNASDFNSRCPRFVLAVLAWLLAVASIVWSLAPLRANAMADFETTANWVQGLVPPDSVFVGDKALWFAFRNQPFVSWQDLEAATRADPAHTLEEELRSRRPDYVIVGLTTASLAGDVPPIPGSQDATSSGDAATVESFLVRYGRQVAEIHAGSLGDVRAYRMRWR